MTTEERKHIEKEWTCPKCGGELVGNGDNTMDCENDDFHCHEEEL